MSAGEGFGPAGRGADGPPPFAVAGPVTVMLDGTRSGTGSFTVSNVTGRPVRARLAVVPGAGADASWFQVAGEAERALPVAGTATVDLTVRVPDNAPGGLASFQAAVSLEEAPDQVVMGPTVVFTVPQRKKRTFPWWIVIVAAVAVLLLVGGGILIWLLTRPAEPVPSSEDVFLTGEQAAYVETYIDLDEDRSDSEASPGMDVYFYAGAGSGEMGVVGQGPPRLAVVDEPTFAVCENATGYSDLNAQNVLVLPDRTTYVCVRFTDQDRLAVMEIGPVPPDTFPIYHPVIFTTWERDASG